MFDKVKIALAKWLVRDQLQDAQMLCNSPVMAGQGVAAAAPQVRIGILEAINGRILEIGTYKPNLHGPDWTNEYYLVREDETLSDALTLMLLTKNLK